MKRLALVVFAFVGPFILGACQEKLEWTINIEAGKFASVEGDKQEQLRFEEIMPLPGHLSPHQQGGDCWGDYFFQFVTDNSQVRIYDLSMKTLVQTLTIPGSQRGFVSNCHCNTVCFGTEYYDVEDIFPLIYVSTGYAANGYTGALVYRIVKHNGTFFITLVQTIKFPVAKSSWTEFIPGDDGFAYLYYTSERTVFKVEMPKLKDGDIIIERESAIEIYHFTASPDWMEDDYMQDHLFYRGAIYYLSSDSHDETSAIAVLNLQEQKHERIVRFKEIGLTSESESIFIWQGDIYVAFINRLVRLIDFINIP